jgi:hypothetical protein
MTAYGRSYFFRIISIVAFLDLAVGAPYEGNGAVYIFNGGKDGINPEYSQVGWIC